MVLQTDKHHDCSDPKLPDKQSNPDRRSDGHSSDHKFQSRLTMPLLHPLKMITVILGRAGCELGWTINFNNVTAWLRTGKRPSVHLYICMYREPIHRIHATKAPPLKLAQPRRSSSSVQEFSPSI